VVETDEKTRMHGVPEQIISRDNEDSASSAENVVTCSQKVEDFKGARELLFVAPCSGSFLPSLCGFDFPLTPALPTGWPLLRQLCTCLICTSARQFKSHRLRTKA